jgi:hypothetical protein
LKAFATIMPSINTHQQTLWVAAHDGVCNGACWFQYGTKQGILGRLFNINYQSMHKMGVTNIKISTITAFMLDHKLRIK